MKLLKKTIKQIIAKEIVPESRVLDLGCGDGTLLDFLITEKNIIGHGIEIDTDAIVSCVEKGIPVVQMDLDYLPLDFPDNSFDMVILNQTIQEVHYPDLIIKEILRIGKEGILAFPNFGTMKTRKTLFFRGVMPVTDELPYSWYNSPNIHLLTIKDFFKFCEEQKITITKTFFLKRKNREYVPVKRAPNLRADLAIFKIKKVP